MNYMFEPNKLDFYLCSIASQPIIEPLYCSTTSMNDKNTWTNFMFRFHVLHMLMSNTRHTQPAWNDAKFGAHSGEYKAKQTIKTKQKNKIHFDWEHWWSVYFVTVRNTWIDWNISLVKCGIIAFFDKFKSTIIGGWKTIGVSFLWRWKMMLSMP